MWYPTPNLSEGEIYQGLEKLLAKGQLIELKWDCGGDQAIVYLTEACEELRHTHPELMEALTLHIMNRLNLPDVGEFSMVGSGKIEWVDDDMVIVFKSIMKGYEDYDPNTHKYLGYKETNEIDPSYTGEKKLFN